MIIGIILAGGENSRMYPATKYVPKIFMQIDCIPIIDYHIDALKKCCHKIYILTGKKGGFLKNYYKSNHIVEVLIEDEFMGTAGCLNQLFEIKEKDHLVIMMNGDNLYCGVKLKDSIDMAISMDQKFLIHLAHEDDTRDFGLVTFGEDSVVTEFKEKPKKKIDGFVNSGLYVFHTPMDKKPSDKSMELDVMPKYARKGNMKATIISNVLHINSMEQLEEAQKTIKKLKLKSWLV